MMNRETTIELQAADGWAAMPSSLKRPDGKPRFWVNFPMALATDVGAQHLVVNESGAGYEPPTRDLIERTLQRGDLFVDVGAHWGFFSLQAASHPCGDVAVVAFEPDILNAATLTENVVRNRLADAVTVVCAACGDKNELAPLMTNSTMGHSIRGVGLGQRARGPARWVPVVTLDGALTNLSVAAERRIVLKIDAEGFEPNVILGARSLLAGGQIALIVWECGHAFREPPMRAAMLHMVALLEACGFAQFRPPDGGCDGLPIRFDPQAPYVGNVFSFAHGLAAAPGDAGG
jgi:FkbM family methyltransferase